jgi:hypothetical protein
MIEACPQCNGKVSTDAKACPHCGAPRVAPANPNAFLDPKANTSSLRRLFIIIFAGIGVVVTVMFFLRGGARAITGQITLDRTFRVPQHYIEYLPVDIRTAPGTLAGHFEVRGKSIGIPGAIGDTLDGFHIEGPNNQKMDQLLNPIMGNFSVQVPAPGTYTLVFRNNAPLSASPREVRLTGKYQPN